MDIDSFNTELLTDPEELGYAGKTDEQLWTLVSTKDRPKLVETRMTELGIFALLADNPAAAETLLQTLEGFAELDPGVAPQAPLVKRMIKWLQPGTLEGLDMGNPALLAVLDELVAANVITGDAAAAVTAIRNHCTRMVSRLDEINCSDANKKEFIHQVHALGFEGRDPAAAPPPW